MRSMRSMRGGFIFRSHVLEKFETLICTSILIPAELNKNHDNFEKYFRQRFSSHVVT